MYQIWFNDFDHILSAPPTTQDFHLEILYAMFAHSPMEQISSTFFGVRFVISPTYIGIGGKPNVCFAVDLVRYFVAIEMSGTIHIWIYDGSIPYRRGIILWDTDVL